MNKYEKMSEFFNKRAYEYDDNMKENVESFDQLYTEIAVAIPKTSNKLEILDIGCGTGLELAAVFKKAPYAMITGIDVSGEMLGILKEKYNDFLNQITLILESYLSFSFETDAWDYIMSVMTLHHLLPDTKRRLYGEIRKALKPGGKYIEGDYVTTPEKEKQVRDSYYRIHRENRDIEDGTHHIDIECSLETQKGLLLEAGFSNMEVIWQQGETAIYTAGK